MNKYWSVMIVLGALVLWTFLSLLPRPGFNPMPLPEFISAIRYVSFQEQEEVKFSFHDIGYENSWIQFKDEKEHLVQVQAVESKIVIVFRLKKKEDLARYNIGWIAPITILCARGRTDCEIGSQEKTYISNREVQPVIWKTYGSNKKLKTKTP